MFWQYDIKTVVDFKKIYYALDDYPDFSDCEGIGFSLTGEAEFSVWKQSITTAKRKFTHEQNGK